MIQLRKLAAQRADRTAVTFYVGPVRDQNMDEAPDAICGLFPFEFPLLEHLPSITQTRIDHGVKNFIFGFEVIVKIAARDLQDIRNVRERGVLVTLPISQLIGSLDNVIAGCPVVHENVTQADRASRVGRVVSSPRRRTVALQKLGRSS